MKALLSFFVLTLLLGTSVAMAQTTDTTRQRPVIRPTPPDTLPPVDSAANDMEELVDSLAPAVDTLTVSAAAQAEINKIIPKKATIRSVILPGWGQFYNRQKWKIPVIYAGFGTFAYFIITYTGNYQEYLAGYQEAYNLKTVPGQDPGRTKTAIVKGRELNLNQLKQGTDFWRRWRDYNYIFTALFYGLNIVDANVSAHLKTFDVSDSLTLKYAPTLIPTSAVSFVPGIKLTMVIK
ncbi:DUF5683 domain-containing protein [Fibrella aestuarina]|nr:DUF5683 domain-containing protein [Fibrella aestuarina]